MNTTEAIAKTSSGFVVRCKALGEGKYLAQCGYGDNAVMSVLDVNNWGYRSVFDRRNDKFIDQKWECARSWSEFK